MSTHTVFWSWQSDRPNSTNRTFIENCLERALKEIQSDEELKLDPCLDRDTTNVPGSPDIPSTIFDKIKRADVFVGDVSFVDDPPSPEMNPRRFPNPNVLLELGFAASARGWNRIICVFNLAFGKIEDLPFDIRLRRSLPYYLREGEDKSETKRQLTSLLKRRIEEILSARDEESQQEITEFVSSLASELFDILIFGNQFSERKSGEPLRDLRYRFLSHAENLRNLAATDIAHQEGLGEQLTSLAYQLDEFGNLTLTSGSWPRLEALLNAAVKTASEMKAKLVDNNTFTEESLVEVKRRVITTSRRLAELAARSEKMAFSGQFDDLSSQCAEMGLMLQKMSLYKIDSLLTGLGEKLRAIGKSLHLIETVMLVMDGGHRLRQIVQDIQKASSDLSAVAAELQFKS